MAPLFGRLVFGLFRARLFRRLRFFRGSGFSRGFSLRLRSVAFAWLVGVTAFMLISGTLQSTEAVQSALLRGAVLSALAWALSNFETTIRVQVMRWDKRKEAAYQASKL